MSYQFYIIVVTHSQSQMSSHLVSKKRWVHIKIYSFLGKYLEQPKETTWIYNINMKYIYLYALASWCSNFHISSLSLTFFDISLALCRQLIWSSMSNYILYINIFPKNKNFCWAQLQEVVLDQKKGTFNIFKDSYKLSFAHSI